MERLTLLKLESPFAEEPMLMNMDRTVVYFEMMSPRTIAVKGMKDIAVRGGKGSSRRITVCLSVLSNWQKLKPFVIFKGKPGKTVDKSFQKVNAEGVFVRKMLGFK